VLILDGASIHKMPEIRDAVEGAGGVLLHAPAYSPDLMLTVEGFFAKMKGYLRGSERHRLEQARALARCGGRYSVHLCLQMDPFLAIAEACEQITPEDCQGWMRHSCKDYADFYMCE